MPVGELVKIFIPVKPLTANHIHKSKRNGHRYMTSAAISKQREIYSCLMRYRKELLKINKTFNNSKHYLLFHYATLLPNVYTKKGLNNKKAGDWDNFHKLTQDVIFEFFLKDLNDADIFDGRGVKLYSKTPGIYIFIAIMNREDLSLSLLVNDAFPGIC